MDRVPELYRIIIDDVLRAIKLEFEKFGFNEEEVALKTTKLQQKWETKINMSQTTKLDKSPPARRENGCLDPTNSPLIRHSQSVPTKAEKRKQERVAARASKKAKRANGSTATGGEEDDEEDAPARARAPLSYPVLDPRAASQQQLLLAQLQQQAPLQAIAVNNVPPSSTESTLENPFETQPAGSKKRGRKVNPPKPMMPIGFVAMPPPSQAFAQQIMQFQADQIMQQHQAAAAAQAAQESAASSIPQQDGGDDDPSDSAAATAASSSSQPTLPAATAAASSQVAPSSSSAAAAAGEPAPAAQSADAPMSVEVERIIAVPPSLTSSTLGPEDDDSDDDAAMVVETEDLVLCQFEKVAHVKDTWKVVLKDGIIRVNKRDFVFSRATGEFEW